MSVVFQVVANFRGTTSRKKIAVPSDASTHDVLVTIHRRFPELQSFRATYPYDGEEITINYDTDWENALLDYPNGGLVLTLQGLVHHKTKEQKEKERVRALAMEQEVLDTRERRLREELQQEKERRVAELRREAEKHQQQLMELQEKYYKNMEGVLQKKSPSLLKLWQKRFFCLDKKANVLQYWGDRGDRDKGKQALGTIAVDSILHCRSESGRKQNKFIIETTERVFKLQADSSESMSEWVTAINKFMEMARIENVIAAKGVAAMAQNVAESEIPDKEMTLFDIFQEAELEANSARTQEVSGHWLVSSASKAMTQHPLHGSVHFPPRVSSSSSSSSSWDEAVFCSLDESAGCIKWYKREQARFKANPDGVISLEHVVQAIPYTSSDSESKTPPTDTTMRLYHEGTYVVDVRLKTAFEVKLWCRAINRALLCKPHPFIERGAAVDEEIRRKIADYITSRAQQNPKLLLSGSLRKKGADFIGLWKKRFVVIEQSPLNDEHSLVYYNSPKDYKDAVEVRETLRAAAVSQTAGAKRHFALGKLMIRDIDRVVVPDKPANAGPVRFFNLHAGDRVYQFDAGSDSGDLGDNFVLLLRSLRTKAIKRAWRQALHAHRGDGHLSTYINSFVFREQEPTAVGAEFDIHNKRGMFVEMTACGQVFRTAPCEDVCGVGNSRAPTWQQKMDLVIERQDLADNCQLRCVLAQGSSNSNTPRLLCNASVNLQDVPLGQTIDLCLPMRSLAEGRVVVGELNMSVLLIDGTDAGARASVEGDTDLVYVVDDAGEDSGATQASRAPVLGMDIMLAVLGYCGENEIWILMEVDEHWALASRVHLAAQRALQDEHGDVELDDLKRIEEEVDEESDEADDASGDINPVVIDFGGQTLKLGIADSMTSISFPCRISDIIAKEVQWIDGSTKLQKTIVCGNELKGVAFTAHVDEMSFGEIKRDVCSLSSPDAVDFKAVFAVMEHAFIALFTEHAKNYDVQPSSSDSQIKAIDWRRMIKERPIILCKPIHGHKELTKRLQSWVFDDLKCPMFHATLGSPMAVYNFNTDTALVVDMGYSGTRFVPIVYGRPLEHAMHKAGHLSGSRIFPLLHDVIGRNNSKFNRVRRYHTREVVEDIVKRLSFCATSKIEHDQFLCDVTRSREYLLPTDKFITLHEELTFAGEALFRPKEMFQDDEDTLLGLHEALYNTLMQCPIDARRDLSRNVILCGGLANLKGVAARLRAELELYATEGKIHPEFQVREGLSEDSGMTLLKGGMLMATMEEMEDRWIFASADTNIVAS